MEPLTRTEAIIDFCLAPLELDAETGAGREVRRRLTHVLRAYQGRTAAPVEVDFSTMPPLVINEAAHGNE